MLSLPFQGRHHHYIRSNHNSIYLILSHHRQGIDRKYRRTCTGSNGMYAMVQILPKGPMLRQY
jgi:hypothetical protein